MQKIIIENNGKQFERTNEQSSNDQWVWAVFSNEILAKIRLPLSLFLLYSLSVRASKDDCNVATIFFHFPSKLSSDKLTIVHRAK